MSSDFSKKRRIARNLGVRTAVAISEFSLSFRQTRLLPSAPTREILMAPARGPPHPTGLIAQVGLPVHTRRNGLRARLPQIYRPAKG